jgi:catechol 2,3-dioxygenase-like lactoylglutathione lyase family enzyme
MLANARLQTIVCTTDIERAEPFYRDTLGLPLKQQSEGARVFDVGGAELRLSPVDSHTPGEHTLIGFAVADLDAVLNQLQDRGVEFERFAQLKQDERGVVLAPGGARVAWLRDPDGNLMSVVEFAED